MRELITLHVNGERHELAVLPHHTLCLKSCVKIWV